MCLRLDLRTAPRPTALVLASHALDMRVHRRVDRDGVLGRGVVVADVPSRRTDGRRRAVSVIRVRSAGRPLEELRRCISTPAMTHQGDTPCPWGSSRSNGLR